MEGMVKKGKWVSLGVHIAGWVVGYWNCYMLRNVKDIFCEGAWWGALPTLFLSIVMLIVGAITFIFQTEYVP